MYSIQRAVSISCNVDQACTQCVQWTDTVCCLLMGPSIGVAVGLEPCQDDAHIFSHAAKNGGCYTPSLIRFKIQHLGKAHVHLVQN